MKGRGYNEAFAQGDAKSGLGLLLDFVRNIPTHPEWMDSYMKSRQQADFWIEQG